MKIRPMVYFILIFTSVLPFLFFSQWLFSSYSNKIESLLSNNLQTVTLSQKRSLEWFFTTIDHSMSEMSNSHTMESWLELANKDRLDDSSFMRPFIDDLFQSQVKEYDYLESVTLLDRNFRIIACSVDVPTGQQSRIKGNRFNLKPGQTFFSSVASAEKSSSGKEVFAAIRPISYVGYEIAGYLIMEINLNYFEDLRSAVALDTHTICLVDNNGNIVTAGNHNMTREEYLNRELDTEEFYQQWNAKEDHEAGSIKYTSNGVTYLSYYISVLDTNWRLFVSINLDKVLRTENNVIYLEIGLWIIIIIMLLTGRYFLSERLIYPVERLIDQVKKIAAEKNFQLRIRRMPKNEVGDIAQAFNDLLSNIENNAHELWRSKEKYSMVISETNHIFFERDYKTGEWFVSNKFEDVFGYPFPFSKLNEAEGMLKWIHKDDHRRYINWLVSSYKATEYMQIEVRMKKYDGSFFWVQFILLPVKDDNGKVNASIGLMKDVDEEKNEVEALRSKARHDPLTGLLNKGAVDEAIRRIIKHRKRCAVFFIDIDDFKEFNTKYGHNGGDKVLKYLAAILKVHIKNIIGRCGGDEFIACLVADDAKRQSELCAKAILADLAEGMYIDDIAEKVIVRCSIGIAIYPETAINYEEILSKADDAMYKVKHQGKNNYYMIK